MAVETAPAIRSVWLRCSICQDLDGRLMETDYGFTLGWQKAR